MNKYIVFDTVTKCGNEDKITAGKRYELLDCSYGYRFKNDMGDTRTASKTVTLWGERRIVEENEMSETITITAEQTLQYSLDKYCFNDYGYQFDPESDSWSKQRETDGKYEYADPSERKALGYAFERFPGFEVTPGRAIILQRYYRRKIVEPTVKTMVEPVYTNGRYFGTTVKSILDSCSDNEVLKEIYETKYGTETGRWTSYKDKLAAKIFLNAFDLDREPSIFEPNTNPLPLLKFWEMPR